MVELNSVNNLSETPAFEPVPQIENGWPPSGGPVDPANNGGIANWQALKLTQRDAYLKGRVEVAAPPGIVLPFAFSAPPTGWLECDGSAIARNSYADLFAAIGVVFGNGDGTTTFNLPDLRGEFLRGWDHGRGVDSGRQFGSAQADEIKSHSHKVPDSVGASNGDGIGFDSLGPDAQFQGFVVDTSDVGGPETRPRNIAMLFCIKF